jgi:hypothetical protein
VPCVFFADAVARVGVAVVVADWVFLSHCRFPLSVLLWG